MKITSYRNEEKAKTIHIIEIEDVERQHVKLTDLDRSVLRDAEKSVKVADKILALHTLAFNIEQSFIVKCCLCQGNTDDGIAGHEHSDLIWCAQCHREYGFLQPKPCPKCGKPMKINSIPDEDAGGNIVADTWWDCPCGHEEKYA